MLRPASARERQKAAGHLALVAVNPPAAGTSNAAASGSPYCFTVKLLALPTPTVVVILTFS